MPVAITYSSAEVGIDAPLVTVEVDVSPGLPQVLIVGMAETAVRESKDRIRAAYRSCGLKFPDKRITVNLAPADLPKAGGRYDLAIAIAILAANGEIEGRQLARHEFLGELSLTGELRGVSGVLPAAVRPGGRSRRLIVPLANADEAALSPDAHVFTSEDLTGVISYLNDGASLPAATRAKTEAPVLSGPGFDDVRGQEAAKRALMIAAAGGHNLLMVGPPGTGKTMLANRLPALLPALSQAEALEVASIVSVSGHAMDTARWRQRPFRAPHHTTSAVALVGGSRPPKPGEISLAHHGVLFLDELPEFPRRVLEVLREPLESGEIWISRAGRQVRFPARFQLIAAMNPCPCGHYGDMPKQCECPPDQVERYRTRLSGPLLDRIDLQVQVPRPAEGTLRGGARPSRDQDARLKVERARSRALTRQGNRNSDLAGKQLEQHCQLQAEDEALLENAVSRLGLSVRGYFRVLRVARTIADLDNQAKISASELLEALSYRSVIGKG